MTINTHTHTHTHSLVYFNGKGKNREEEEEEEAGSLSERVNRIKRAQRTRRRYQSAFVPITDRNLMQLLCRPGALINDDNLV